MRDERNGRARLAAWILGLLPVAACARDGVGPEAESAGEGEEPESDGVDERAEARFAAERERMVALQIERRGVSDPRVLAAMRAVPRHRFVPPDQRGAAYADRPLPIGSGQTISQPFVVALMTEALGLEPGERVLEVGTGSGYQAAVLAEIADEVYSIEIVPELGAEAARVLGELGYDGVRTRVGDGYFGWPEAAPFDAIVVTAAPGFVPPKLFEQLAPGGRMVLPVGERDGAQHLRLVAKEPDGTRVERDLGAVRFVPMTGEVEEGEGAEGR